MISPLTRFCVGCGHVFDELLPSDHGLGWISGDAFRVKYGFGLDRLTLRRVACPPCARVFAIGRRHLRLELAERLYPDEEPAR
jgi:hypothetical protein